jgi:NAD(P)H dehydrogenase (quinone)
MRALLVSAPPTPRSLTMELARTAESTLSDAGHEVDHLDLRAIGWDPVVRPTDFGLTELDAPVGRHARQAAATGLLDPQLAQHQDLVRRADLIVLTFPLWWAGMPAVLKGWFDRVFTEGFAYGLRDDAGNPRKYGDGAFAGKRGLVITTTGDRASAFGARGVNGHLEDLLFGINHGIFWYTGIEALEPLMLLGVDAPTWGGIEDAREQVARRLATVATERPVRYRRLLDDYDDERRLLDRHAPGRTDLAIHRSGG